MKKICSMVKLIDKYKTKDFFATIVASVLNTVFSSCEDVRSF